LDEEEEIRVYYIVQYWNLLRQTDRYTTEKNRPVGVLPPECELVLPTTGMKNNTYSVWPWNTETE
jgi:hypothetical protein